MKKKKKSLIIIIAVIVIILISSIFLFNNTKNTNKLSLNENKWLDKNKYDVVDVAVLNDVAVVGNNGEGLVYDYLDYVTNKYGIKFNIITYKTDTTVNYDYKLDIVDIPTINDIVVYKDNMILVTNNNVNYNSVNDIKNIKIGILKTDKDKISNYLQDKTIQYVEYDTYADLKNAYLTSVDKTNTTTNTNTNTNTIDSIITLKSLYTEDLIKNDLKIAFQFNDLNKSFVLTTGKVSELNSILNKTYNTYYEENYEKDYNTNLLNTYFDTKQISDVEKKNLQSKSYNYGFVNYGIYNYLDNKKISGLSSLILKGFNKFSNISISYTQYNSVSRLLEDFNASKVDFILNTVDSTKYSNSVYTTSKVFDKNLMIISGLENNLVIDSIYSLKDKEVLAVRNSYIEQLLKDNGVKVKSYNNLSDLTKDFKQSDITIIDLENYNYYKTSAFKNVKINYMFDSLEPYSFIINDSNQNKVFEGLFDFYVNYTSLKELSTQNYKYIAYNNINITYILILIIIILLIYLVVDFYNHFKVMIIKMRKNKKVKLSKEEKIKYIDQLTSLKNRAYLNSRIESWDDSEVYPQSIIIIDLNNISYINDNYGREEGDKVITEAANILIMNQMQNSEIIRTDGNEFLIYLVGYTEKQIISYLRKLNKELKNLSHGFGAASGYSIINDGIKTIDDAVNEATLDMKNNKEDIEY